MAHLSAKYKNYPICQNNQNQIMVVQQLETLEAYNQAQIIMYAND